MWVTRFSEMRRNHWRPGRRTRKMEGSVSLIAICRRITSLMAAPFLMARVFILHSSSGVVPYLLYIFTMVMVICTWAAAVCHMRDSYCHTSCIFYRRRWCECVTISRMNSCASFTLALSLSLFLSLSPFRCSCVAIIAASITNQYPSDWSGGEGGHWAFTFQGFKVVGQMEMENGRRSRRGGGRDGRGGRGGRRKKRKKEKKNGGKKWRSMKLRRIINSHQIKSALFE